MLDCVNSREQFKEIKVQFLEASSRSSSTLSVLFSDVPERHEECSVFN